MQPALVLALAFAGGAALAAVAFLALILILAGVAMATGRIVEPFA